ncbi:MAG: MFS transporter, partial [Chloroflexota bacterium]
MTTQQHNLRTFYTLIITQTLSLIGSRVSGLALGIWIFNDTGNATPLALAAFFSIVPNLIMTSFAGVLADRWDRRYVMAISDIGQAVG